MDEADAADDWWQSLPDSRRVQIHRWVTQNKHMSTEPIPGQLALINEEEEEA